MLDRPRHAPLTASLITLVVFVALAVVVAVDPSWLTDLNGSGRHLTEWASDNDWTRRPLRLVEIGFGIPGTLVMGAVLAAAMWVRSHRRAAILVAGVTVATHLASRLTKVLVDGGRPPWQSQDAVLTSPGFPSTHVAVTTALAGLCIVLAVMLIRRAAFRRLVYMLAGLVTAAVAADRLLLGRHYPGDVAGGVLLGAGIVLLGLALYSPLPRTHSLLITPLRETFPSGRNLAVILNPVKVESVDHFQSIVNQMAGESGWNEPSWLFTTVESSGTRQAHDAAVEGADLVIVCGGDGTVREVCAELAGTGIPVGIVPAGTGNLLARNLEIPLFIRAAIDIALTGQDRAIDMVRVSGDNMDKTHFLVMAGMGLDAAIMEGVNEDIKQKVGWFAYVISAFKAMMFPAIKLEVSVDDMPFTTHRARTCVIGNVGMLQGGMVLIPDATLDDGRLDVVLLYPRGFLSWAPLVWRVLRKREEHAGESVIRMTGRKVVVRAATDVPRQLDGDTIESGSELTAECIHGRLLVRVPR